MMLDAAFDLKTLTELLEITQPEIIVDLKESVIRSFDDPKAMRSIVDRQCENRKQTQCYSCGNEAGCLILNGIAYLALGETEAAIKNFENANQHFRNEDETWNHIIGLTLLGSAYEKSKKDHRAFRTFEKAHHVIKNIYLRIHANDYIEKAQQLENVLKNKITELSASGVSGTSSSKTDFVHTSSNPSNIDNKDNLALFSIPIYGTVEAGPDGELYVHHSSTFTLVNKVELQGQTFGVYGIRSSTFTDRQITLNTIRSHGWLRVHGLSMNGWDLPFDENDYVLFYKASAASHLDFVIASNVDPSGEMALIVKRFDAEKNQLISKSKDTSNPYYPIPLDEDHQTVGVVIAVAKPTT